MKLIYIGFSLILLSQPAAAAEYVGNWQDGSMSVGATLKKNGASGCGEFYQKQDKTFTNEWLVACTRDGKTYSAWQVWPNIGKAIKAPYSLILSNGGPPRP